MGERKSVTGFLENVRKDDRILPSHLALFMAMLHFRQGSKDKWFRITRRELMDYSKLRSRSTYHKCLNDLVSGGYIRYEPSYDPILASRISIC